MIEFFQQLDSQFLLALNGFHTPMADRFMWAFTGRWVWVPLYVVLAWFVVKRMGWRYAIFAILAAGISVAVADQTCATLLRPIFERLRPANVDNPLSPLVHIVDGYRGGAYGFPSCHAANTFALATFFAWLSRRNVLCIILFIWAIGNCYTRMYLGVHYPGDIIAGALVGGTSGTGFYWLAQYSTGIRPILGNSHIRPVIITALAILAAIMLYSIAA